MNIDRLSQTKNKTYCIHDQHRQERIDRSCDVTKEERIAKREPSKWFLRPKECIYFATIIYFMAVPCICNFFSRYMLEQNWSFTRPVKPYSDERWYNDNFSSRRKSHSATSIFGIDRPPIGYNRRTLFAWLRQVYCFIVWIESFGFSNNNWIIVWNNLVLWNVTLGLRRLSIHIRALNVRQSNMDFAYTITETLRSFCELFAVCGGYRRHRFSQWTTDSRILKFSVTSQLQGSRIP